MAPYLQTKSAKYSMMMAIIGLAAFATCSKDEIKSGRGRGASDSINLVVPKPAGNGLLDGSGDMAKAKQPIIDMTTCNGNEVSLIPARTIRLTMPQLRNAMSFHSKIELSANDFSETAVSTTNFIENSYSLHGHETFVQNLAVKAKTISEQIDVSKILSCTAAAFANDQNCQKTFFDDYVSRVLNTNDQSVIDPIKTFYSSAAAKNPGEGALRAVIRLIFQHPLFLYRSEIGLGENGKLNSFELAAMLSYTLSNSPPDDELWQAAKSNQLNTDEQLSAHFSRLISNQANKNALYKRFFFSYLGLTSADGMPTTSLTLTDIQSQETAFLDFVNQTPIGKLFKTVSDGQDSRLGAHAHRYYMMNRSKGSNNVSSIFSGIAIRNDLLCQSIAPPTSTPPPESTDPLAGIEQRKNPPCSNCHQYIDPVGQNYLGFQASGAAKAGSSDLSSEVTATIDFDGTYADLNALSAAMGDSDHLKRCLALQVYRFALARPEQEGESCHINAIYEAFNNEDVSFDNLILRSLLYAGNLKRK